MSRTGLAALNEQLDSEWLEGGFLYKLRECEFDAAGYARFEALLGKAKQTDSGSSETIDRDFVRLMWFVPQFVEWQVERVLERGGDPKAVHGASSRIRELVGEILGEP